MGNDLTTIHHPVATRQGDQALRGIARSHAWGETTPSDIRRWLTSELRAQLPMAIEEAQAKLKRSVMADARRFLLPALALVAPAGMSAEDQTAWLASALDGLSGIPADLLVRGCAAAKRVADHPSKIVKAIYAEVGAEWERRKGDLANVRRIAAAADGADPEPRPWEDIGNLVRRYATPEEVAAVKEDVGLKTEPYPIPTATRGPARKPTVDDYVELGLSREAAEQAVKNADQTEREMEAARTESRTPVRDRLLRENGHFLLAKCIAQRFVSRGRPGFDPAVSTDLGKQMIAKHGAPPFPWILDATRQLVAELRFNFGG